MHIFSFVLFHAHALNACKREHFLLLAAMLLELLLFNQHAHCARNTVIDQKPLRRNLLDYYWAINECIFIHLFAK